MILPALVALCLGAVCADLRTGKVPNALNGLALASGLLLSGIFGGATGVAESLEGALMGLSILLVPFLLRMVGGGDVKFLAAAGSIVGWRILMPSFLAGAAFGAVMGLVLLASADRSLSKLRHALVLLHAGAWRGPAARGPGIAAGPADVRLPYAVPLSLGLVTVTAVRLFV